MVSSKYDLAPTSETTWSKISSDYKNLVCSPTSFYKFSMNCYLNHKEPRGTNVSVEHFTKLCITYTSTLNSLHHCYLCFIYRLLNHLLERQIPDMRMHVTRSWNLHFMVQSFSNSFFWITPVLPEQNPTAQPLEHAANCSATRINPKHVCMLQFTYISTLQVALEIPCM